MAQRDLNRAVESLLGDPRFLRRFRRDPERAVRGLDLTGDELGALTRGDARELLALGVDPAYVWPSAPRETAVRAWLARSGTKLAPAAFLAALLAAFATAGTASAARTGGRRTALRRLVRHAGIRRTGLRRALVRARADRKAPPGLRRAARRAGRTGIRRAIRRVAPAPQEPTG